MWHCLSMSRISRYLEHWDVRAWNGHVSWWKPRIEGVSQPPFSFPELPTVDPALDSVWPWGDACHEPTPPGQAPCLGGKGTEGEGRRTLGLGTLQHPFTSYNARGCTMPQFLKDENKVQKIFTCSRDSGLGQVGPLGCTQNPVFPCLCDTQDPSGSTVHLLAVWNHLPPSPSSTFSPASRHSHVLFPLPGVLPHALLTWKKFPHLPHSVEASSVPWNLPRPPPNLPFPPPPPLYPFPGTPHTPDLTQSFLLLSSWTSKHTLSLKNIAHWSFSSLSFPLVWELSEEKMFFFSLLFGNNVKIICNLRCLFRTAYNSLASPTLWSRAPIQYLVHRMHSIKVSEMFLFPKLYKTPS